MAKPKPSKLPSHLHFGKNAEEQACHFLSTKGWSIYARNFRSPYGEVDIIAWDPHQGELVFVEVKARSSSYFGEPAEAVTPQKRHKIYRTAATFLRFHHRKVQYRFDVVAITPSRVTHIQNISW